MQANPPVAMATGAGSESQKPLQRTASRLLSTLTTYSPDDDQETALMDELRGRTEQKSGGGPSNQEAGPLIRCSLTCACPEGGSPACP